MKQVTIERICGKKKTNNTKIEEQLDFIVNKRGLGSNRGRRWNADIEYIVMNYIILES